MSDGLGLNSGMRNFHFIAKVIFKVFGHTSDILVIRLNTYKSVFYRKIIYFNFAFNCCETIYSDPFYDRKYHALESRNNPECK